MTCRMRTYESCCAVAVIIAASSNGAGLLSTLHCVVHSRAMNDCAMCLLRLPRCGALISNGSAVMFQHIRGECIENGVDFPSKICRRRDQITGERGNESGRMGNCVAKSPSLSDQGGFGSFTRPSRPSLPAEQVLVGLARSLSGSVT